LTIVEMKNVMDYLSADDNTFEEMKDWHGQMLLNQPILGQEGIVTISYVGTVAGPRRPIDRYEEDIKSRTGGVLAEFITAVEFLYPEVVEAAEVYLIKDASLDFLAQVNADDVERMLIQFFGHGSLLNRQRGGFYSTYVPSADDTNAFTNLNTRLYGRFRDDLRLPGHGVQHGVAAHFGAVQEYANGNPADTGTFAHPFSDELRDSMARQGTPMQFADFGTLLVFIGKDIH
jgi:hypothetical protein